MNINKKYLFKKRTLYIEQEITLELSTAIIDLLDSLIEYDKFKGNIKNKELIVICNSSGGIVVGGMEVYHKILTLKELGYRITTVSTNYNASMSTIIYLSGDIRKVGKCVNFLVHCPLTSFPNSDFHTLPDVAIQYNSLKKCWDDMKDIYLQNSNITVEELDKIYSSNSDKVYTATECLELGFATQII